MKIKFNKRQVNLIITALAELSIKYPELDDSLNEIALKMDNIELWSKPKIGIIERAKYYDECKSKINESR